MREKGGEGSREGGGARGTRKPHRDGAESTAILIPWGIDGYYRRAAVAGGIGECQPPTLCATFVLAWCPHAKDTSRQRHSPACRVHPYHSRRNGIGKEGPPHAAHRHPLRTI